MFVLVVYELWIIAAVYLWSVSKILPAMDIVSP